MEPYGASVSLSDRLSLEKWTCGGEASRRSGVFLSALCKKGSKPYCTGRKTDLQPRLVQSHTQSGSKLTFLFLSSPVEAGAKLESKSGQGVVSPCIGTSGPRPADVASVYFLSPK